VETPRKWWQAVVFGRSGMTRSGIGAHMSSAPRRRASERPKASGAAAEAARPTRAAPSRLTIKRSEAWPCNRGRPRRCRTTPGSEVRATALLEMIELQDLSHDPRRDAAEALLAAPIANPRARNSFNVWRDTDMQPAP